MRVGNIITTVVVGALVMHMIADGSLSKLLGELKQSADVVLRSVRPIARQF